MTEMKAIVSYSSMKVSGELAGGWRQAWRKRGIGNGESEKRRNRAKWRNMAGIWRWHQPAALINVANVKAAINQCHEASASMAKWQRRNIWK
jgi:hypothetical protein